jgi:hypothetical protein
MKTRFSDGFFLFNRSLKEPIDVVAVDRGNMNNKKGFQTLLLFWQWQTLTPLFKVFFPSV